MRRTEAMWFHGKSPAEIRERLDKEGIFTKLRKDAELNQKVLEQAPQAPLTQGEKAELLQSFVKDVLLSRLRGITTRKNDGEKIDKPLRLKTNIKAGSPVVIGNSR
jgi:hypothetical protein